MASGRLFSISAHIRASDLIGRIMRVPWAILIVHDFCHYIESKMYHSFLFLFMNDVIPFPSPSGLKIQTSTALISLSSDDPPRANCKSKFASPGSWFGC